jgi:hypothetical protein
MPKLDATHIAERLRTRLADLEAGKEVAAKDIRALLTPEQIAAMEAAWTEQQKLRKVATARTDEEKQALGWKTKRDIHIEAYKQAIADSSKNLASELRKMQEQADIRQFRIYMDTLIKAEEDGYTKEQAKSMANNALTRAGLRRMDGAIVGTVGLRPRDREIRRLEDEIKAHIRKNMTDEEREQADLLEEYEKSNQKNRR